MAAISVIIQTGYLDCGQPDLRKRLRQVTVPCLVGDADKSVSIQVFQDYAPGDIITQSAVGGANYLVWDVGTWGLYWSSGNITNNIRFKFHKTTFNKVSFKFSKSCSAALAIQPFVLRWVPRDWRDWAPQAA